MTLSLITHFFYQTISFFDSSTNNLEPSSYQWRPLGALSWHSDFTARSGINKLASHLKCLITDTLIKNNNNNNNVTIIYAHSITHNGYCQYSCYY